MKRFLFIFGALVIVAVVIGVGYLLRYQSNAPEEAGSPGTVAPGANLPPGTTSPASTTPPLLTPSPSQKLSLMSQNPVREYFLDNQSNLTLVQPDGQIVKITKSGVTTLSSTPIANLINTSFSSDGLKVLAVFGEKASPQVSIFDVASKTWQPLNTSFESGSWSPVGQKLVYFEEKPEKSSLFTLDFGNPKAKPQEVLKIQAYDLRPHWTGPQEILLAEKSSSLYFGSLLRFDLAKKTLSLVLESQPGLEVLWDSSSSRGLFFRSDPQDGGKLNLFDRNGTIREQLKFLTLPTKCVFGSASLAAESKTPTSTPTIKTVIRCAVPRGEDELKAWPLPDTYQKKSIFTSDDFYEIDLTDGAVKTLFSESDKNFDAENLKISGNRLYFVNRYDNRLYSISLSN